MSLTIYEISDTYINYLKKFFYSTILDSKEGRRKHGRKYIGTVLQINNYNYFIPMSSPKKSDYDIHGNIRESSLIVLRMIDSMNNKPTLLGTLKLNNMIPVPNTELIKYNLNSEQDQKYKDLILNETRWIQKNTTNIKNAAKSLYSLKFYEFINRNEKNNKFYESIMPFREAEIKCDEYTKKRAKLVNVNLKIQNL